MTDGNVNFHGDEQTGNGFSTQWRDEGADIERQLMNSHYTVEKQELIGVGNGTSHRASPNTH